MHIYSENFRKITLSPTHMILPPSKFLMWGHNIPTETKIPI